MRLQALAHELVVFRLGDVLLMVLSRAGFHAVLLRRCGRGRGVALARAAKDGKRGEEKNVFFHGRLLCERGAFL